jgi:uncharacterized membrane protein YjgN (DUF898 family)
MSPAAQQETEPAHAGPVAFEFTGSGSEYFRIWIVNLLLTVATFGVYSAWAKVRRLEYFYRNTRVAGAIFDYHGSPKAILKGRVLAFALFLAYKLAFDISGLVAAAIGLLIVVILPWLLSRSFQFRLANSSYRGVRFHFAGTVLEAYRSLILLPAILVVTGLFIWSVATTYSNHPGMGVILLVTLLPMAAIFSVAPMAHYLLKRYQHDHAYLGQSPFFFQARPGQFFKVYGKAVVIFLLGFFVAGTLIYATRSFGDAFAGKAFGWLIQLLFSTLSGYLLYLSIRPYLESRLQNLIWNKTELSDHRFISTARARTLMWLHASNLVLVICSAGLYQPFATIRILRYRLACLALQLDGTLDDMQAHHAGDGVGAAGDEVGAFFDIDISL